RSLVSFSILTRFSSFSFTEPATTEIYTLSLHDALPICRDALALFVVNRESRARTETGGRCSRRCRSSNVFRRRRGAPFLRLGNRSEEHTSELQSRENLVCRLLLEKKKKTKESETQGDEH